MAGKVTRHRLVNPAALPRPRGFSYGAVPAAGRTLFLAGMTGVGESMIERIDSQYEAACRSMVAVLSQEGGEPTDLVSLIVYTTDMAQYRASLGPIGEAHRRVLGDHYPPMALIGVTELFEPGALVELVGTAVVPD